MPKPIPLDPKMLERVRHGLSLPSRNPLDYWRHSSDKTRRATRALAQKLEVFLRAGNKAGKTNWGAAVVVARNPGQPGGSAGRGHLNITSTLTVFVPAAGNGTTLPSTGLPSTDIETVLPVPSRRTEIS